MNKQQTSVAIIIPEDQANRDILVGFIDSLNVDKSKIDPKQNAGGWEKAIEVLIKNAPLLEKNPEWIAILVIDFDGDAQRRQKVISRIAEKFDKEMTDRVFIFGVLTKPDGRDGIKTDLKSKYKLEEIGRMLSEGCPTQLNSLWIDHPLLKHNLEEVKRFNEKVDFLFKQ